MSEALFPVVLEGPSLPPRLTDQRIVFHGINKSGSLALTNVIREAYFLAGRGYQFFSNYHGTPNSVPDLIRIINSSRPHHAFYVSHYLYGRVKSAKGTTALITQFRHPLPRMVSCYQWLKNKNKEGAFPSLEEFVARSDGKDHTQIAQFGVDFGKRRRSVMEQLSAEALFDRAIKRLERDVSFIGIAEHFESTIFLLCHLCGLSEVPAWKRDERNPLRTMAWSLPPGIAEMIRDKYRYDFALYDWALERFQRQLASVTFGASYDRYVAACVGEYKDRLLPSGERLT